MVTGQDGRLTRLAERDLVTRARTDRAAFGALYDHYCVPVYAYAYHRLGNHTLAEDVTSQTFVQALAAIDRYEDRGVPFSSWLFRIAANVIVSTLRRQPLTVSADSAPDSDGRVAVDQRLMMDSDALSPSAEALRLEQLTELRLVLDQLPEDQRHALVLRFGHDLRIRDVAVHMRRSEGAVKMLLLRGLTTLRRLLPSETEVVNGD